MDDLFRDEGLEGGQEEGVRIQRAHRQLQRLVLLARHRQAHRLQHLEVVRRQQLQPPSRLRLSARDVRINVACLCVCVCVAACEERSSSWRTAKSNILYAATTPRQ